jgi:hypothetical protein
VSVGTQSLYGPKVGHDVSVESHFTSENVSENPLVCRGWDLSVEMKGEVGEERRGERVSER